MKRRNDSNFVLFDVTYRDGTRSSNRKVLGLALRGLEGDEAAKAIIEAQDRKIGAASGQLRADIKAVARTRV
jgi:hypothetical protein